MRNLPFDVRDDEIRDLCAPWGQVVAIKSKVSVLGMEGPCGSNPYRNLSAACHQTQGPTLWISLLRLVLSISFCRQ